MATESVDIILSAKDNATGVLRKTSAEMKLLQDRVQQTGDQTKRSSDAIQKFANLFGGSWLATAASGMKELSDATSQSIKVLQAGGPAATAMKAGLVGLVATGSVAVGKMLGDWVFETKRFNDELERANQRARELGSELAKGRQRQVSNLISDIKEFGGSFDEQKKLADEALKQLGVNQRDLKVSVEAAQAEVERLEGLRKFFLVGQAEVDNAKANLDIAKQNLSTVKEGISTLQNQFSEGEKIRLQKREELKQQQELQRLIEQRQSQELAEEQKRQALATNKISALEDEILKLQTTAEEYEKIKAISVATNIEERERLELLVKQKFEIQNQAKAREEEIKKQEALIKELESFRIDVSRPALSGRDERITTQARGSGDLAQQQVRLTEVQVELQRAQKELAELMESHLNVISKQEDPIVNLLGA